MWNQARRGWLWIGATVVVAWRIGAFLFPHEAATDPKIVSNTLAVMGLWFLACGVWVALRSQGLVVRLLAVYGVASGIHWGGPMGFGPPAVRNLLLATYVLVSTVLAQSLFLHLALAFPEPLKAARSRGGLLITYLPAVAGVALLVALLFRPSQPGVLNAFGLLLPLGVLYSLAAGVVWIRRWAVADSRQRRAHRLGLIVGVMIGAWLPHAAASAFGPFVPPYDGLLSLTMSAIPAVLAAAIVRAAGRIDV